MKVCARIITLSMLLLLGLGGFTQQLSLGKTPYSFNKSAVLELNADNQGLLLSRLLDTTSINTLSPPDGMMIYFVPTKQLMVRINGYWNPLAASALLKGYWSTSGNANGSMQTFGNTDNLDLPFITNNLERMRLTASGNLGIGTSAPSSLLHVFGANPLRLTGVQPGTNTTADSLLTINAGVVQKLPVATFQNRLNGTGFVKASGTTITYDNNTYTIANSAITGATKTKITYDSKGLVTAGADATTTDIGEGTNLYFTEGRVRSTPLTGFSASTATAVTATDNLLVGVGKLQGQINNINNAGYLTGNQNITLGGDVSGSGTTAITTTIGANKVTLGHMAQVGTGTFLGRATSGTGNVEALTTAQAKTLLGLTGNNSGDVSLAGQNYLSLTGQTITANPIDLSGTHATGTLAAGRFGALTGDVTNSAGSYATTIANGAVTYGKMQNVSASNRLLGRASAGAGTIEELTIGAGLSLSGTTLSANGAGMWSTTGNSGTNSGTNFLGTTDNISLRMRTNNTERMVIDSIGRIGFGVSNPTNPFVFRDTVEIRRTAGSSNISSLLFTNTASSGDFRIGADGGDIFWQGGGNRNLQMGSYWGIVLNGDRQSATFPAFSAGTTGINVSIPSARAANIPLAITGFASQTGNLTEWRNSGNTALSVVNASGNFGIGTSAPASLLHVFGANPLRLTGVQAGGTTTSDSLLTINNGVVQKLPTSTFATTSGMWSTTGNSGTTWNNSFLGTTDNQSLRFRTNNIQRLWIDSLGNGGFGTAPLFTTGTHREKFLIDAGTTTSYNLLSAKGTIDNYLQLNIQNRSNGNSASTDIVATADNGNESTNYIDLGINGSGYNGNYFGGSNDAYLYNLGQDLLIGTGTNGASLKFLTSGGNELSNTRMTIDGNGNVGIGTTTPTEKLDVAGNIEISGGNRRLSFKGLPGDLDFDGVIELRNTIVNEQQEMLFYVGNDNLAAYGPDRIRMVAEEFRFQTFGTDAGTLARAESGSGTKTRVLINDNGNVAIGDSAFDATSPETLLVNAGSSTYTPILAKGNYNGYFQINVKNNSTGNQGSSDIVATANNGTETTGFINMGINGSGYVYQTGSLIETGAANDGYLLSSGENLYIVNNNANKDIIFLAGGTSTAHEAMRIKNNEQVLIGTTTASSTSTKLEVNGGIRLGTKGTLISNLGGYEWSMPNNTSVAAGSNYELTLTLPTGYSFNNTRVAIACSPSNDLPTGVVVAYARAVTTTTFKFKLYNASAFSQSFTNGTKLYFSVVDY